MLYFEYASDLILIWSIELKEFAFIIKSPKFFFRLIMLNSMIILLALSQIIYN